MISKFIVILLKIGSSNLSVHMRLRLCMRLHFPIWLKAVTQNYFLNLKLYYIVVQSPSRVQLFETPWTAGYQASLSFTISRSLVKFMSIGSVRPSNHFTLCHSHLLLPSICPRIRVFSNELALCIRCPK